MQKYKLVQQERVEVIKAKRKESQTRKKLVAEERLAARLRVIEQASVSGKR